MALDSVCDAGCISENITEGDHNGDRLEIVARLARNMLFELRKNYIKNQRELAIYIARS